MSSYFARLKLNRPLVLVLTLFVALALFYSIIIPLFEGPDEDDHFRYARYLADQRALPIQEFQPGGGVAGHQGWQPPLYYSLAALVIAPIDTTDFEQHLWRNYAATSVGDPACCGRNIYYHTDSENFPFTRTTLAVHLARLLSIFFGAVTVWATYRWVVTLLPALPFVALASAAIVAFNPSFLFASALVSNDAALAAFSTCALLLWIELLNGPRDLNLRTVTMLGAVIGLGILTKTTALALVPFSMVVLFVAAWRKRDWRLGVATNVALLGVVALIAGGWFARNTILYGDPLAYRLMTISALFPRAGDLTLPELFQISLPWLWQTFWGGPTPGDFSPAILIVLAILFVLSLVGLFFFLMRNSQFALRSSILILAAWLMFILIAQIQFVRSTTGADQGRYLFPAISVIAFFFVVGLEQFVSGFKLQVSRFGSLAHWLIFAFVILALFVPFAYTLPAYARPTFLAPSDEARIAHPYQATFDDKLQLLGYDLNGRAVKPGENLSVALYWRALASMSESYRVFVQLVGGDNHLAGGADVIPARGAFPTVYWKPGAALRDVVQIPVAADAAPGKYSIQVGWYPVGKPGERLTITNSGDSSASIATIKVAPRTPLAYTPRIKLNANFGDAIELMGYDWQDQTLTLYWRALAPIDGDDKIFIHALDAGGAIVWQVDQEPQAGNYPTAFWDTGEQVADVYAMRLPANARKIFVGVYRADSGERLPVAGADQIEITMPGTTP